LGIKKQYSFVQKIYFDDGMGDRLFLKLSENAIALTLSV